MNKEDAKARALELLERTGTIVTPAEAAALEVADFGLNNLSEEGLQLIVYENNARYCAKELVLFAGQTCPEHRHPPVGDDPGKMETFRCRWGKVYLAIEGEGTPLAGVNVPESSADYYTIVNGVTLEPGEQYTIAPNTRHWFQAGAEGAVVSEFSSTSRDESDIFTDPRIVRVAPD